MLRLPFTRAYDIAKLNRDAPWICEDAERRFRPEQVREVTSSLRRYLAEAEQRVAQPRMTTGNVLAEFRTRHREVRRRREDRELSAITLAIIRLRAEELGADEALAAIDRFLERWPEEVA